MEVIGGGDLHRLLHIVSVVQNQAQQRGRGQVGPVGVLICGHGLRPLIGHVDAAAHTGIIHTIQRRVGRGETGDFVHQALKVRIHANAQELQVRGGDGGVAVSAAFSKDQAGIGLGEVVVPAKEPIPLRGLRGEGGTGNLRSADAHVQEPFGDVGGNKGDQLAVTLDAALL